MPSRNIVKKIKRLKNPQMKRGAKIALKKDSEWKTEDLNVSDSMESATDVTSGGKFGLKKASVWKTEDYNVDEPLQVLEPSSQRADELDSSVLPNPSGKFGLKKASVWKTEDYNVDEPLHVLEPSSQRAHELDSSVLPNPSSARDRPIILEEILLNDEHNYMGISTDDEYDCTDHQMVTNNFESRNAPDNTVPNNDEENDRSTSCNTKIKMEIEEVQLIERDVLAEVKNITLRSYEKHSTLDDDTRKQLIHQIMDCIFNEGKLERPDLEQIATDICSIYHDEDKNEHCDGRTGLLYNAFNSRLRKLRSNGVLPKSKRALNTIKRIQEAEAEAEAEDLTDSVIDSIEYLQSETMDFDDCLYHWSNSYLHRMSVLKKRDKNLRQILNEWKVLELPMAHILIIEDFKVAHGEECSESLCSKWASTFTEDKIKIIKNQLKDKSTKIKLYSFSCSEEYTNISLGYCLLGILFPALQKGKWRPTIKDAQNSVILITQSEEMVSTKIGKRMKYWKKKNLEPYPFIVVLDPEDGPIEFLVIFHTIRFNFKSFLEALDICCKMFFVFNIPFPKESKQFYVFLNELFYKIPSAVKKSSKILSLLRKIR